ncbi:DHS-like NAD/FAD-binding domain-containing protein [Xylaria arbuscula]|nr:DHS-like NAD/FAD-binding domain-containing protein [Xylaria arbuscula]
MPTVQVTPHALDLLQNVADALAKSRKMVIITGAGISTNSGIPDFRSENGLYSLIQDQFERAEAANTSVNKDSARDCDTTPPQSPPSLPLPPPHSASATTTTTTTTSSYAISERPLKRLRTSGPDNLASSTSLLPSPSPPSYQKPSAIPGTPSIDSGSESLPGRQNSTQEQIVAAAPSETFRRITRSQTTGLRPTLPRHLTQHSVDSSTSRDSVFSEQPQSCESSQTEDSVSVDGELTSSDTWAGLSGKPTTHLTTSSSPLSSPPPGLFDSYENTNSGTDNSSQEDSYCSDTFESDDTQQSLDFFSSQASNSNLRNMKGKDLFDCNIWSDPLKTSVFYRFATSLRQRVKEVEPTVTHRFIAQMRDIGKLARVYTQNIDEIEKKIGLSTDLKHGYGNKKRKSIRQQPLELLEKEEVTEPPGDTCTTSVQDAAQTSKKPEDLASTLSKHRPPLSPDRGVECVFLHGSLHSLRCFVCGKLCDWEEDGRESCTLSGEQPECPHCAGATAARQERGKRALGVGKLRPDIVLYGEEHPQSDLISPIVQHDLVAGPDLLLVLGTSLRVHGLKVMVKEFAKAVHKKGGKVVFINFTKPSESAWGDVLDYWIEWDCDAWVEDLKTRKPRLWLSPEGRLEMERQRRESLAEKKREGLRNRESSDGKKRDSLEGKSDTLLEQIKPRLPPKNPVAMRNDFRCAAYIMWDICQALCKIGGRPFDNLGYTPPATTLDSTPLSSLVSDSNVTSPCELGVAPQAQPGSQKKIRRPRPRKISGQGKGAPCQPRVDNSNSVSSGPANTSKSSPSVLFSTAPDDPKVQHQPSILPEGKPPAKKRARKPLPTTPSTNQGICLEKKPVKRNKRHDRQTSTGQFFQAARELARSRKTPTPGVSTISNKLPVVTEGPTSATGSQDQGPRPIFRLDTFAGPRDVNDGKHPYSTYQFQPRLLPPPRNSSNVQYHGPSPVSTPQSSCSQRFNFAPVQIAPLRNEGAERWKESPPSTLTPMEINPDVGPGSPLTENRPGANRSHCYYTWYHYKQPIYNDSLVGISRQTTIHKPQWLMEPNDEKTPSPSDQLRMEAATQLSQLRGGT